MLPRPARTVVGRPVVFSVAAGRTRSRRSAATVVGRNVRIALRLGRTHGAGLVLTAVVMAVGLLSACSVQTVAGTPKLLGDVDPGTVAGLPATDGPSGLRNGV